MLMISNCLTSAKCDIFADDTQIASASNDNKILAGKLNNDLVNISDWIVANKLSLNASKTECMLIGSHKKLQQNRNNFLIEIDKEPIECVNVWKSLGVTIDETLTWHFHVHLITKKVNSGLYVLKCLWDLVDVETLLAVYKTLIKLHFDYCFQVWGCLGTNYREYKIEQYI